MARDKYSSALILAGGFGTRMRRMGSVLPKCVMPIYDQPLLVRQIEQCVRAGVARVFVSVSARFAPLVRYTLDQYLAGREPWLASGTSEPVSVEFLVEEQPLGACGGLLACAPPLRGSPTILILGDEFYEHHTAFDALHAGVRAEAVVLGATETANPSRIQCNIVHEPSGRVVRIREKPAASSLVGRTRWCGLMAIHGDTWDAIRDAAGTADTLPAHIGDLFERLRAAGVSTGLLWVPEVALNVNTTDDAALATLLNLRHHWLRERPEAAHQVERAVETMLGAWGISNWRGAPSA